VHGERLQGAGGLAADVDVGIQQQGNKHLRITSRAQRAAQACNTP
jgi:shikimate 5-dehydrogenase